MLYNSFKRLWANERASSETVQQPLSLVACADRLHRQKKSGHKCPADLGCQVRTLITFSVPAFRHYRQRQHPQFHPWRGYSICMGAPGAVYVDGL